MRGMLVTAVWGGWYTDVFGNLLMKSLLAPGNLPKAAQLGDVSYKIYCDLRTASRLQTFPAWPAFRDAAKTALVIPRLIDYDDPIESHHRIWSEALRTPRQSRAKVIFVAPDTLWSDGSIGRLMELFSQGYPAIFFPGLR